MSILPFQRQVSNTGTEFLGSSRDEAAMNAANNIGAHPDAVTRRINPPTWPSIQKFDNDTTAQPYSPLGPFRTLSIFGISRHQMVKR